MSQAYAYDVFISYSHADKEWVNNTLRPRLRDAGLKAYIDRNFLAGDAALSNIADAIKRSRHSVLVLTPDWVSSPWTLLEGQLAMQKHLTEPECRTVPVLLHSCEIPDTLSILTYVDLTREDQAEWAWAQLLDSLRIHQRGTPAPGTESELIDTTPDIRSATSQGTPPNWLPLLFLNLLIAVLLAAPRIVFRPCLPEIVRSLGVTLIILFWWQILWRYIRPAAEPRESHQVRKIVQLANALHAHGLPTLWLWVLALSLSCTVFALFFSPVGSPRGPEMPPTVDGFLLVHHNGSEELVQIGGLAKIRAGETVLISAQLRSYGSPRCRWLTHRGRFEDTSECETVYFAPADGAFDNLSIRAKSKCQTRDAFAGLTIKVLPVEL